MPATPYSGLIRAARYHLKAARGSEATYKIDKFWSDEELLNIATRGTTDLWAKLIDLHEEHFLTNDGTNVSLAASTSTLTGVPTDTFRIYLIEPRNITSTGTARDVSFVPRDYNHMEFINARAWGDQTPSGGITIFYAMSGAGAPNAAPTVTIAPTITSAIDLRFVYIPTLGVQNYTTASTNPIPGESDHAIIAWIVAYAMAKESADKRPDPGWLAVYATEAQSLMMRSVPRQEQEPVVVDGLFDAYWSY